MKRKASTERLSSRKATRVSFRVPERSAPLEPQPDRQKATLDALTDEQLIERAVQHYYTQSLEAGLYAPEVSPSESYVTRSGWIILRNTFRELARFPIHTLEAQPAKL